MNLSMTISISVIPCILQNCIMIANAVYNIFWQKALRLDTCDRNWPWNSRISSYILHKFSFYLFEMYIGCAFWLYQKVTGKNMWHFNLNAKSNQALVRVMRNQLWINIKCEVCYFCTPFEHEKLDIQLSVVTSSFHAFAF